MLSGKMQARSKQFQKSGRLHLIHVAENLTQAQGLDPKWARVSVKLCEEALSLLRPDVVAGDVMAFYAKEVMDICHYARIKTFPGN